MPTIIPFLLMLGGVLLFAIYSVITLCINDTTLIYLRLKKLPYRKYRHIASNICRIEGDYGPLWSMQYNTDSGKLRIGCRWGDIEYWDNFFSRNSKEQFTTVRYSMTWCIIRRRYKRFRNEIKKQS